MPQSLVLRTTQSAAGGWGSGISLSRVVEKGLKYSLREIRPRRAVTTWRGTLTVLTSACTPPPKSRADADGNPQPLSAAGFLGQEVLGHGARPLPHAARHTFSRAAASASGDFSIAGCDAA